MIKRRVVSLPIRKGSHPTLQRNPNQPKCPKVKKLNKVQEEEEEFLLLPEESLPHQGSMPYKSPTPYIRPPRHRSLLNFMIWLAFSPFIFVAENIGLLIYNLYFLLERRSQTLHFIRTSLVLPLLQYLTDLLIDCFQMLVVPFCRYLLKPYIVDPIKKEFSFQSFNILLESFYPLCDYFTSINVLTTLGKEAYDSCFKDEERIEQPQRRRNI